MPNSIVCFGEIMLRLCPLTQFERLEKTHALKMDFAGAKSNVAVSLAKLGHTVRFVFTSTAMTYKNTGRLARHYQLFALQAGLLLTLFVASTATLFAQLTTQLQIKNPDSVSLDEFCRQNPAKVAAFFDQINLDYPGLASVKTAANQKDWPKACTALLTYYQTNSTNSQLRTCTKQPNQVALTESNTAPQFALTESNAALQSVFTFQGITDTLPKRPTGNMNWFHKGPNNDIEWAYFLNRTGYFNSLLSAHCQTGDPVYAQAFNRLLLDWVVSNPMPDTNTSNATWRVLEVGLRLFDSWPTAFYGFQQVREFTPVGRLLMLMSIYDQAVYTRKFHWVHHNHGVMELNGLTRIALSFPEFKPADEWYRHALSGMAEEFRFQSYPDGAMKELTNSYHWVVVRNFLGYAGLHKTYNKPLPQELGQIIERMCNYMAYTARPDGYGLLNNDADLINNYELLKPLLSDFLRPDWQYLFSHGKEGKRPAEQPSMLFPWAGQFIMRNGWGEVPGKDHFAYFDMGPWGTSHQHNDKLHLSVYANGREMLSDAGRMYYKIDKWRQFFNLSVSHNVISLDGRGQNNYAPEVRVPIADSGYSVQPELDFSIGTYQGGFNDQHPGVKSPAQTEQTQPITGRHTRAVIYLKNRYWIVVDQVQSNQPRILTAYWHFNPACSVIADGQSVRTNDPGQGNLRVMPISAENWNVNLVKGQETPSVQGWYSERYNQRVAAYCAEYSTKMADTSATFAWILYPSGTEKLPVITARLLPAPAGTLRLDIQIPGEKSVEIAVNMGTIQSVPLSNGYTLNGRCAVLRADQPPLVVQGKSSPSLAR